MNSNEIECAKKELDRISKTEEKLNEYPDVMKCPECGGWVKYVLELIGSYKYPISSNGEIDYYDKDFYGDSRSEVQCSGCEKIFLYKYSEEGKIILKDKEE